MKKEISKCWIIAPSCIYSAQRVAYAKKSWDSLRTTVDDSYPVVIVDDIPRHKYLLKFVPNIKFIDEANKIYRGKQVFLKRRYGFGSRSALVSALKFAQAHGAEYVFIHHDDAYYIPIFAKLLEYAITTLFVREDIMAIKLVDSPILSDQCTPEQGNLSRLVVHNDHVKIPGAELSPQRYDQYTLWSVDFNKCSVEGSDFYPITTWFTLYRATFLEKLLCNKNVRFKKHLSDVEWYYKNSENWNKLIHSGEISGEMGYINMQFGGFEMHRNANWQEMIRYPNSEVR